MVANQYINEWTLTRFTEYLQKIECISANEAVIQTEIAGEGNMNLTLRVHTADRALIVKQSVPYVAKYPSIAAPVDRIEKEIQFYQSLEQHPSLAAKTPKVLHLNSEAHIAVLEDLGNLPDYTFLYQAGAVIEASTLQSLTEWLAALHRLEPSTLSDTAFENAEMLRLNHAHIFDLPFHSDNGFDLEAICSGLSALARELQSKPGLVECASKIGRETYLSSGPNLTHGDFYPGSILQTDSGPRVIDPEFCSLGRREFDLGVFYAHLILSDQSATVGQNFLESSQVALPFDSRLTQQIAGIEIIRRIIGIAQLPTAFDLETRKRLLDRAVEMIL